MPVSDKSFPPPEGGKGVEGHTRVAGGGGRRRNTERNERRGGERLENLEEKNR